MATQDELKLVKAEHSGRLLATPGVSGVGIEKDGAGDLVLTVYLSDADARKQLPDALDGHPVNYILTGAFRKQ